MAFRKFSVRDVEGMTNLLVAVASAEEHDAQFEGAADGELCEFAARAFSAAAEMVAQNHKGEVSRLNAAYRIAGSGRIAIEVFARRLKSREPI